MKLAFFEVEGWEEPLIRENFPNDEIFLSVEKLTASFLGTAGDSEVVSTMVGGMIDKSILELFPKLKLFSTRSTGYDHVDLAACKERGVSVVYVPGYGDNTVAEFVFGLILALMRKIYHSIDQVKESGSFSLAGLRGSDLKGKVLGIVGTGRIGKEVIAIANGFRMQILAHDLFEDKAFAAGHGFQYVSLPELLGNSHVVSLHCPHTKETHHLINKGNIAQFRKGAYFVNTARGGLVETAALVEALQSGILAGAALDVLEEEGDVKDEIQCLRRTSIEAEELRVIIANHVLMKMPNVLITPHNAFNSEEALRRICGITIENIKKFLSGAPQNTVPV